MYAFSLFSIFSRDIYIYSKFTITLEVHTVCTEHVLRMDLRISSVDIGIQVKSPQDAKKT